MKKFHWGHGIAIFYIIFAGALVTALVASRGVDHSLVVDDYYAKDLAYQSHYNKSTNSLNDDRLKVTYDKSQQIVDMTFSTSESISGEVQFYRPSDKKQDFIKTISKSNSQISTSGLTKGVWKLKVDWKEGNKSYYKEKEIYI